MNNIDIKTLLRIKDIASEGILSLKEMGVKEGKYVHMLRAMEKESLGEIIEVVATDPFFKLLCEVRGIGAITAIRLMSEIDVEKAPTISSLWRYAGMGVHKGKADAPVKGEQLRYNKELKVVSWLIGESLLQWNEKYREVYDRAREKYSSKDWPVRRKHLAAKRIMVKVFLSHYWIVARKMKGLKISKPYANDVLGLAHYYSPKEFGWQEE